MTDMTRSLHRNLEHDFSRAIGKAQGRAAIVPHNDMVKERVRCHASERWCEYAKPSGCPDYAESPCQADISPHYLLKPECPEQLWLTIEEHNDLRDNSGRRSRTNRRGCMTSASVHS
jgi:hypothetical protein